MILVYLHINNLWHVVTKENSNFNDVTLGSNAFMEIREMKRFAYLLR